MMNKKSAVKRTNEVMVTVLIVIAIIALIAMVGPFHKKDKEILSTEGKWLFLNRADDKSQPKLISITSEQACKQVAAESNIKNGWNKNPERFFCYPAPENILDEGLRAALQRPWPEPTRSN